VIWNRIDTVSGMDENVVDSVCCTILCKIESVSSINLCGMCDCQGSTRTNFLQNIDLSSVR